MPERWDCLFVDRIESLERVVLVSPPRYGEMYSKPEMQHVSDPKVRLSVPELCDAITGRSNESKVLRSTALAIVFNKDELTQSNGLILRVWDSRPRNPGLQTMLNITKRETLLVKDTTGWQVFISPGTRLSVMYGKIRKEELPQDMSRRVKECVEQLTREITRKAL